MQGIDDTVIFSGDDVEDREIKDWRQLRRKVLLYQKYESEKALRDDYAAFMAMPLGHRRESDWKSLDLFGASNKSRYEDMLSNFLKNDIEDSLFDKQYIPMRESEGSTSKQNRIINKKINIKPVKEESYRKYVSETDIISAAESCIEIKSMKTNISNIAYLEAEKEIKDRLDDDNMIALSITPYYTPYEMEKLGITSFGAGLYSNTPDNIATGLIDIQQWFQEYKNRFNGFDGEDYIPISSWVESMKKLYYDYKQIKESGDKDAINNRKQAILNLGWNPEIEFNEANRIFASRRINNIIQEQYSNYRIVNVEDTISSLSEESNSDYIGALRQVAVRPIYIVFFSATNTFNKIVRMVDRSVYNHVSISFDASLETLYSFDAKYKGFTKEYMQQYIDQGETKAIQVFCVFIDNDRYEKLKKKITYYEKNKSKMGYSFINLLTIPLKISYIDKAKMVCSQFVDSMLKLADLDFTGIDSSVVSPGGLNRMMKKYKGTIYKVYTGSPAKYSANKVSEFINKISASTYKTESSILKPLLSLCSIIEAKEFPLQFSDDGDLLISKGNDIDFEGEYSRCHIALVEYDKAGNVDGMKYCLCKLWYMNIILEEKIHNDRKDKEKLKQYHKARAKIMNDIKTYMKKVQRLDKGFNMIEEYNQSPFNDQTIKIRRSTLLYTIDLFKRLIGAK